MILIKVSKMLCNYLNEKEGSGWIILIVFLLLRACPYSVSLSGGVVSWSEICDSH